MIFCSARALRGDIPEPDFEDQDENLDIPDPDIDEIDQVEDNAPNQFDIVSGPRSKECITLAKTLRK